MTPEEERALIDSLVTTIRTSHERLEQKLSEVEEDLGAAYYYIQEAHRIAHSYAGHESGAAYVVNCLENGMDRLGIKPT